MTAVCNSCGLFVGHVASCRFWQESNAPDIARERDALRAQVAALTEALGKAEGALEFCEREAKSVQLRLSGIYEDGGCTGRASDDADGIECCARAALAALRSTRGGT